MVEKKSQKTSDITLDDLALMVAKGFKEVDSQFKVVNQRIDDIEEEISEIKRDMATKEDIKALKVHSFLV